MQLEKWTWSKVKTTQQYFGSSIPSTYAVKYAINFTQKYIIGKQLYVLLYVFYVVKYSYFQFAGSVETVCSHYIILIPIVSKLLLPQESTQNIDPVFGSKVFLFFLFFIFYS